MRGYVRVIAVDYDGTLTLGGPVGDQVLDALAAARADGLAVVLVTGRILSDLVADDPRIVAAVDAIVAENGAVLVVDGAEELLGSPPDPGLLQDLADSGVPARPGRVIVAAQLTDRSAIADTILRRSLDLQLVANRGELMVLPAGVTKASGLRQALALLGRDLHNTVAIGDAENDLAMLAASELAVAVANAVPSVRRAADLVTAAPAGAGLVEALAHRFVRDGVRPGQPRQRIELGTDIATGAPVWLPAAGVNLLVTGPSGAGKSWVSGMLVEQLVALQYSVLVLDPQGDHGALAALPGLTVLGDSTPFPSPAQVLGMLLHGPGSIVVDLSQRASGERDLFLRHVPDMAHACASTTGRPHWIVIDEAHDALASVASASLLADRTCAHLVTTYQPHRLPGDLRRRIDAELVMLDGADAVGHLYWPPDAPAQTIRLRRRATTHVRHWHKYRTELLPRERGFFVRGRDGRATGVVALSLAELCGELGHCDADVLIHHAGRHDFSRWIDDVFRDRALARAVADAEELIDATGHELADGPGRDALLAALERRDRGAAGDSGRSAAHPQGE